MFSRSLSFVLIALSLFALNTHAMDQDNNNRTITQAPDAQKPYAKPQVEQKAKLQSYCLDCAQIKFCPSHKMIWETEFVCARLQNARATSQNYLDCLEQAYEEADQQN